MYEELSRKQLLMMIKAWRVDIIATNDAYYVCSPSFIEDCWDLPEEMLILEIKRQRMIDTKQLRYD